MMTADSTCEVRETLEALAVAEVLGLLSPLSCVPSWLGFPFGWGLLSLPMGSCLCRRVWCLLPHSPQIGLNWQSQARWLFKTKAFGRKDVISFHRGGIHDTVALHSWVISLAYWAECSVRQRNHSLASFLWFCHRGEEGFCRLGLATRPRCSLVLVDLFLSLFRASGENTGSLTTSASSLTNWMKSLNPMGFLCFVCSLWANLYHLTPE